MQIFVLYFLFEFVNFNTNIKDLTTRKLIPLPEDIKVDNIVYSFSSDVVYNI